MTKLGTAFGDWQGARLAGMAIALALSVGVPPAAAAQKGDPGKPEAAPNGGPGPQGNPGSARAQEVRAHNAPRPQGRSAESRRTRAHGSPGATHGRKVGATRGTKTRSHGKPRPAAPRTQGPSSHAKAGKTTICHSTGSETNPYVEITVSDNALKAHGRHHDGRDIIPAPAGGCGPAAAPEVAAVATRGRTQARGLERVVVDDVADGTVRAARAAGAVLGAQASRASDDAGPADLAEEETDDGSLPFTGLALAGILAAAALAFTGGAAARRAART